MNITSAVKVCQEQTHKWYKSCDELLWYKILFGDKWLKLDINILDQMRTEGKPYGYYVNERLLLAAKTMKEISGESIGLMQLTHAASAMVLLEGKREDIESTIKSIQVKFPGIDPTVIITSAALYFLLRSAECLFLEEDKLELIKFEHRRLDDMNWFVGPINIQTLGILPIDQCLKELEELK